MSTSDATRKVLVVLLAGGLTAVGCEKTREAEKPLTVVSQDSTIPAVERQGLPRLLDLGAGKCIPCKMMAPILDELKEEFAGSLEVEFIDVWQDKDVAVKYGVETIPTQIFFDASGQERFRHVGFFSKEEILAKWKELGEDLKPKPLASPPTS
jgi:thioredoxin 1